MLAGPDGLLAGLPSGGTWIEMSTNGRDEIVRLAALAAAKGVDTLECPVTGGVHLAAAGKITALVGGDPALYERHRAAIEAMCARSFLMGPVGSAAVIKVITNMLAFIHLVAAGEALMLAKRGGLDLAQAYHAIAASSGTSFVHETESQLVLNGSYDIGFTMDLALKDLGFALGMGEQFGVPLDLASRVNAIFEEGKATYGGDAWSTMIVKLLEDAVGTDLRAPGFPARLESVIQFPFKSMAISRHRLNQIGNDLIQSLNVIAPGSISNVAGMRPGDSPSASISMRPLARSPSGSTTTFLPRRMVIAGWLR